MKRLILIPTVAMTAFLALAFMAPATATGILKTVVPALRTGHAIVQAVRFSGTALAPSSVPAAPTGKTQTASASPTSSPSTRSTSTPQLGFQHVSTDGDHEVATGGETNCGNFGNGHHGGKHDMTCRNKIFPPPAS